MERIAGFCCPAYPRQPVPPALSSFLHQTRTSILMLLLVVLPLQSVAQLIQGLQGQRHVHTQAASHDAALVGLLKPVRALLDRLHAGHDAHLTTLAPAWLPSRGPAGEVHEHGGVRHQHSHDTTDVLDVGDVAEDSLQAGATAFLAWLPGAVALPGGAGSDRPAMTTPAWRDRVVAPPLTPPRG